MAIEVRHDPSNIEGDISWGDEGPTNGISEDTHITRERQPFPVKGTMDFKGGSAKAAARGKDVVMGAIAKASVDAMHRAQQGQGPRQSGR